MIIRVLQRLLSVDLWRYVIDAKSHPILCDSMDCRLAGFSAHGLLHARILEWVQVLTSEDLPDLGIEPTSLRPWVFGGITLVPVSPCE